MSDLKVRPPVATQTFMHWAKLLRADGAGDSMGRTSGPALTGWAKLWRTSGARGRFHAFLSQPLPFDFAQGRRDGLNCGAPTALRVLPAWHPTLTVRVVLICGVARASSIMRREGIASVAISLYWDW